MPQFEWTDASARHPNAYKAEAVDVQECRAELVWTLNPGIKQHHQVTASLTANGGSLWRVEKKFQRYSRAFHFFERMREQAELRLSRLNCAE